MTTENEVPAKIQPIDTTRVEDENNLLVDWLARLKNQLNTIVTQIRNWVNVHVTISPPYYVENPHQQYWHKTRDPAWMHMYFQDFTTSKVVAVGGVVTNWTGNIISDWQLVSDPVTGTVVLEGPPGS